MKNRTKADYLQVLEALVLSGVKLWRPNIKNSTLAMIDATLGYEFRQFKQLMLHGQREQVHPYVQKVMFSKTFTELLAILAARDYAKVMLERGGDGSEKVTLLIDAYDPTRSILQKVHPSEVMEPHYTLDRWAAMSDRDVLHLRLEDQSIKEAMDTRGLRDATRLQFFDDTKLQA